MKSCFTSSIFCSIFTLAVAVVPHNDMFPNMKTVSMNQTLEAIYGDGSFQIKQEYVGPNFKVVNNKKLLFKCDSLMNEVLISDKRAHAPCEITPELQKLFTMDGLMDGEESCPPPDFDQIQNGVNKTWVWTEKEIEDSWPALHTCGAYGNSACIETVERYGNEYIKDKVGMVLGTQIPWLESGLIHYGAAKIITVEYMKIKSEHPKLSAIHPTEVAKKYLEKKFQLVDFIFTYSSLEHDGLGRYGDPINPYADLVIYILAILS